MTIYLLCVNPESDKWVAFSDDDVERPSIQYSRSKALAALIEGKVSELSGIKVDEIVEIETDEKRIENWIRE